MKKEYKIYTNKSDAASNVDRIIRKAILMQASDIHIDLSNHEFSVRYRIDGVLLKIKEFNNNNQGMELISRIKIISNMNITEKRLPQDGSMGINIKEESYDIRVSSIPTVNGESLVLRLLKNENRDIKLESLGFTEDSLFYIKKLISKNNGLLLISGPTGSGKTTTLFSIINVLNDSSKKIITIEDPVEKKIKGITQIQVKEKIGLGFLEGLKHILRSDPDTVVIGEIRDRETAEIAVKSALTGHLVLATIHTDDSLSTIFRLLDMGIPKYLILNSIKGVIAQRLVRKICPKCSGKSCSDCSNGYKGRFSINEVLVFEDEVYEIFRNTESMPEIREKLKKRNFLTIMDDAKKKVNQGITNKKEIYRILGEY